MIVAIVVVIVGTFHAIEHGNNFVIFSSILDKIMERGLAGDDPGIFLFGVGRGCEGGV